MTEPTDFTDKSSDDLIEILREGTPLHEESLLMEIEVELMERDVQYTLSYTKPKSETRMNNVESTDLLDSIETGPTESQSVIFAPLLIGIIFLVFPTILDFLDLLPNNLDSDQILYFIIGYAIFNRIIVLSVIENYTRRLNLKGGPWYVLGIIFGTWTLFAYNIYLWVRPRK